MRTYEVLFIVVPQLSEEEAEAVAVAMQKTVEKKGSTVDKMEKWGKRRLAYSLKKQREGYYFIFNITGDHAAINELERKLKQTDQVLRFMTVRTDLEQKAYAKRLAVRREAEQKKAGRRPASRRQGPEEEMAAGAAE